MKKILLAMVLSLVAYCQSGATPSSMIDEINPQDNSANGIRKGDDIEEMRTAMKNAGLPDGFITECLEEIKYGGIGNLIDTSSLKSLESDYSVELSIDHNANPKDRYKGKLRSAPSAMDVIILGVKMLLPIKMTSLSDITYNDFAVYTVLENLQTNVSYAEVTPGGHMASYKYKLENPKNPDSFTMLERFSNLKSKLPADYTLDKIYFESIAKDGRKSDHTMEEWIEIIGEKKFKKQWEQFLKHYKVNQ